jgi:poly(3-hydroxybutyrate) depolymerase
MGKMAMTSHLMLAAITLMVGACSSASPAAPPDVAPGPSSGPDRSLPWVTSAVQAPGVQHVVFESAAVGAPVSYHIYLPERYAADPTRRFPVLYWLHGAGSALGGIGQISAFFAQAMTRGDIPPALIVFPNGLGESMWTNSKDGRVPMETVVVRDLLNHVDATFRTVARRDGRILEGFSMGGRGAGRLGFRYPELFATVSMLGAGPLDADFMGPMAQSNPALRARIFQDVWGNDLDHTIGPMGPQPSRPPSRPCSGVRCGSESGSRWGTPTSCVRTMRTSPHTSAPSRLPTTSSSCPAWDTRHSPF